MKKIVVAILTIASLTILAKPIQANEPQDASRVVKVSVDKVVALLKNKSLAPEVKKEMVMNVIKSIFDFDLMAKLTLGRNNWVKFSPTQREEFVTLFTKELENTYYGKTEFFSDEEISYGQGITVKNKVHIPTSVVSKDEKLEVVYKLYKNRRNEWRIYDATIQGVSIISSFRAQYNQFLSKHSVSDFLKELKLKTSKTTT